VPFDSVALVSGLERIVQATVALFGRAPYRDYLFAIQDGAYGALEHANSVTLGGPSVDMARDLAPLLAEASHEYVHAWNLMRIRPIEYADLTYGTPKRARGLWFSEGLTIFYSDLLRRRVGLSVPTATRAAHLETLIARYLSSPGNSRISAERVSEAAYGAGPDALGDYTASTHLQGELIGAMLDLEIRHATAGRRSMDDVMRLMLERYSGDVGFTSRDVQRVVEDVCRCTVSAIFDASVRGAAPIRFDDFLRYAGLRAEVTWRPALGADGHPAADLRAYPYDSADSTAGPRLALSDPASAWGRAGLHTGDRIRAMNGQATPSRESVRRVMSQLRSGDTVRVDVEHGSVRRTATVVMAPFDRPFVELREIDGATAAQRALRTAWESGKP
jgi:predicted metalloprotease with PDZ domain